MSSRSYPQWGGLQKRTASDFCMIKVMQCDRCHAVIPKDGKVYVAEIQVSWFRGDDEVHFLCRSCRGLWQQETSMSQGQNVIKVFRAFVTINPITPPESPHAK